MSENDGVSVKVVEGKREFLQSDFLSQVQKIERKVFPKHEAMTETFGVELKKENTYIAIATSSEKGGERGGGGQTMSKDEARHKKGPETATRVVVVGYILFVRSGGGGQIIKLCVLPTHRSNLHARAQRRLWLTSKIKGVACS
mmetsp:Transcript_62343/g.146975  ORF Transcript_62343/g.146975 Transcript_62343/m.146975 type:complete len:143 (+) Transcript_62343:82-510(+)